MTIEEDYIVSRGIRIPPDDEVITLRIAKKLRREFYETPELRGLSKFVKPSARVLELGAGIGYISTFLVKDLGVSDVTVVEANPLLCKYISKLHAANDVTCARVLNGAAFPDTAELPDDRSVPFYVTKPFWSSSLAPPKEGKAKKIQVPALRLSDLVAETKPTVIVCDIEGGEVDLFKAVDLTGVRHIYLELHTRVTGGRGIVDVFDNMHRNGFYYHQRVSNEGVVLFERL